MERCCDHIVIASNSFTLAVGSDGQPIAVVLSGGLEKSGVAIGSCDGYMIYVYIYIIYT